MAIFDEEALDRARRDQAAHRDEFARLVDKFGNAAPERARSPETHSGLPLQPAYFPADVPDVEHAVTGPGQYPYRRGLLAAQHQLMHWANQPVIGYGLPEDTRSRMDLLTAAGMGGYGERTFYNLVYDLVSHEGLDPDHPAARGRVGRSGMAVYSKADMRRLFDGIDLAKVNVVHITFYQTIPALAQYIAYGEERGYTPGQLRGNTMNYYYQSAFVGMSAFPPAQGHKLAVELISYCSRRMPQWNTTNFVGYDAEEAGATAPEEIGLLLAYGIELVRSCIEAGLEPGGVLPRFGFQIAQSSDFFEEICKVRALRQLWATTMRQRFGVDDPKALHARIHTHTSGVSLTASQPLVNLIRTSLQALGAGLAGVQAMEVAGYDEALSLPNEEAATLALRVQQVIQEEANVASVSDPLGGSYYVEALTDQVAAAAQELVEEIGDAGGYVAAHAAGMIRRRVEASAQRWADMVKGGTRRIVGRNCYRTDAPPPATGFDIDPQVERIAVDRIRRHRSRRDQRHWQEAMAAFAAEARRFAAASIRDLGDARLMAAAVGAASADATTGEMMGVLKEALGWGPPYG